jgi:predicted DNA-binding transcriptional regulator YafY
MVEMRSQIRAGRKIRIAYRDEQGRVSDRTVWPIAVAYFQTTRLLVSWCEMRQDFRHFRTDRIDQALALEERYPDRLANLRARWRKTLKRPPTPVTG